MLVWIDRIVHAFALWFGGAVLMALVALTVTDVTGRYFFDRPVYGSLDLYGVLLASVVAVCIPYGQRTGAHVAADIFANVAGPTADRIITIIVRSISALVAGPFTSTLPAMSPRCWKSRRNSSVSPFNRSMTCWPSASAFMRSSSRPKP